MTEKSDYQVVRKLVLQVRQQLPRAGCRKVYYMIYSKLKEQNIKIGRDKLFDFLRSEHLLITKRKKYHKTTNSKHWMRRYPNIVKEIDIIPPEQVWVADITYVLVQAKHYYLHLLTDAYSKKIVGYQLSDNMLAQTTHKALKQAILSRKYCNQLIHHPDRGLQYCSGLYTEELKKNNIIISMTEKSDPYENAIAERINGILKYEFGLDQIFDSFELLEQQTIEAIALYNQVRPHMSIELLTPNQAHQQQKIIIKKWKSKIPPKLALEG
ncbi:MAG: IS3 family transposase [Flavobacteriales bacterium]|nr:IS3 family transposase [Flavobacteriales bacterium]